MNLSSPITVLPLITHHSSPFFGPMNSIKDTVLKKKVEQVMSNVKG